MHFPILINLYYIIINHCYLCQDLARMYDLVSKIPDGLNELKRLLETYIYNQGMEAIEKCCEAAINVRQNLFI